MCFLFTLHMSSCFKKYSFSIRSSMMLKPELFVSQWRVAVDVRPIGAVWNKAVSAHCSRVNEWIKSWEEGERKRSSLAGWVSVEPERAVSLPERKQNGRVWERATELLREYSWSAEGSQSVCVCVCECAHTNTCVPGKLWTMTSQPLWGSSCPALGCQVTSETLCREFVFYGSLGGNLQLASDFLPLRCPLQAGSGILVTL